MRNVQKYRGIGRHYYSICEPLKAFGKESIDSLIYSIFLKLDFSGSHPLCSQKQK